MNSIHVLTSMDSRLRVSMLGKNPNPQFYPFSSEWRIENASMLLFHCSLRVAGKDTADALKLKAFYSSIIHTGGKRELQIYISLTLSLPNSGPGQLLASWNLGCFTCKTRLRPSTHRMGIRIKCANGLTYERWCALRGCHP